MSKCESLNKKLLIACKEGDNQLIHSLLAKGASPDEGLKGACESNRKDLAIFMLSRGANPSYGLEGACKGGHREMVDFIITSNSKNFRVDNENALGCACEGGHWDLVHLMIERGAHEWVWGLINACKGGQRDIADFMIEKGASVDMGLRGACEGGQRSMAEYMISRGARNFSEGLYRACLGGSRELAFLMIKKLINDSRFNKYDLNYGLVGACFGGHANLTAMMIQVGATELYRLFRKDIRFIVQVLFLLKGKPFHRLCTQIKKICSRVSDRLYLSNRHILPPLVVDLNTFKCERNIVRQFACDDVATFTARFAANSSVKESEVIKKRKLTFAS